MNIVGLMPVRNASWTIKFTIPSLMSWVDHLCVLDHASVDDTWDVLLGLKEAIPGRITLHKEENPVWNEMEHRDRLLAMAKKENPTHLALLDDDEVVTANLVPHMRDFVEALAPKQLLDLPMIGCYRGLDQYRIDSSGIWQDAWASVAVGYDESLRWRASDDGYQLHKRQPLGSLFHVSARYRPVKLRNLGGLIHLMYASTRRLKAKQALYKMIESVRWPGRALRENMDRYYSEMASEDGMALAPCPLWWWDGYDRSKVDLAQEPWQELEAKALIQKHGAKKFEGLDLFGMI